MGFKKSYTYIASSHRYIYIYTTTIFLHINKLILEKKILVIILIKLNNVLEIRKNTSI